MREGFDPADYSVVVKLRGNLPKTWRWEIYRAGRWGPLESSPVFFQRPRKRGKRPSHTCWRKRNTRRDSRCDLLKAHAERAIFAPMANLRVTCICGAIYEVIETKGPCRETQPFKCVLCDSELISILFGTRACSLNLVTTLPVPATYVWKRKNEVEQIQTSGG